MLQCYKRMKCINARTSRLLPALLRGPYSSVMPKRNAATAELGAPPASGPEAPQAAEGKGKKPKANSAPKAPPALLPVYDPTTMRPPSLEGTRGFRILSWNVAGLRALLKKDPQALKLLAQAESVNVICLQEHKLQEGQHCEDAGRVLAELLPEWQVHWSCSTAKKGYSGTALLCRPGTQPLSVECGLGPGTNASHEGEGRVITAEFPALFLVNVYVPNSGGKLERLPYRIGEWDPAFAAYLKSLEARGKAVVVAGDLNCAAEEADIHNPMGNLRSAGFTPEERASFAQRLTGGGFVDAFRRQHPGVVGYTYWGYRGNNLRGNNKGWRLDYMLVSEALQESVHDCFHLPSVTGSDHCPIGIILKV